MCLNRKRLVKETGSMGFLPIEPDFLKNGLSLYRPSAVEPLYEHILVSLQSAVQARSFISASPHPCSFPIISIGDNDFRDFMSPETWYHQTILSNRDEARTWENKFLKHVSLYSAAAATKLGPGLLEQLTPIFNIVGKYLQHSGDLFQIFDREFAFMNELTSEDQEVATRMSTQASQIVYRRCENAALACHLLLRYSIEVEGHRDELMDPKFFKNGQVTARVHLLTDAIAAKRREYRAAGGLCRTKVPAGP